VAARSHILGLAASGCHAQSSLIDAQSVTATRSTARTSCNRPTQAVAGCWACGVGGGPTELATFDAALIAAGVANFNLIVMGSVIPPRTNVIVNREPKVPAGAWGDRLYVVMAHERVAARHAEAWAGLGWVQEEATGRGLFAQHHGSSRADVERDIHESLDTLCRNRAVTFGGHQMELAGTRCRDMPACALVVATYRSTAWPTRTGATEL
jgi:arginine decarboxylase